MTLTTLTLCIILFGAAIVWIAWPLRAAASARSAPGRDLAQARDRAVRALRDLEFDMAAGLVPAEAYASQKAELLAQIVAASGDAFVAAGDN